MPICNVCNKRESIGVYSSGCGPVSFAYCGSCGRKGAEPIGALAAYLSGAVSKGEDLKPEKKSITESYQKVIDVSCNVAGVTREEFYKLVDKMIQEENEYYERMDNQNKKEEE